MKNLSQNQLEIENALEELNELISHISELTSRAGEILSQIIGMTSEPEVTEPTIFSIPESRTEMPRQASKVDEVN